MTAQPHSQWPHRRRRGANSAAARGFTLVELMIGTVCFALIIGALNSAFYGALRLRSTTAKAVENAIPLNQAAAIIKRDLRGILAPGGVLSGSLTTTAQGVGGSRCGQLDVYTSSGVLTDQQPWGDAQRVSYYLKESEFSQTNRGLDLVRSVTRNLLPVFTNDVTELPLLSGVESLEFSFYDGLAWQNSWDATNSPTPLPQAIKMAITFARPEEEKPYLPPLAFVVPMVVQARTNQTNSASAPASQGGR